MMKDITIVTAFFDIGRENWNKLNRSSNKYIENFKFWARIKNKMIIYTQNKYKDEILKIRKDYGLEKQTEIITIEDIFLCDKEIYNKIKIAMNNKLFNIYRKYPNNPESWNPKYNYLTYLKSYFVLQAVKQNRIKDFAAWIDFGFNNNGEGDYPNKEEFSFLWKYDFKEKIYIFIIDDIGIDRPIFKIVEDMSSYVAGNAIIAPKNLWEQYHTLCRRAIISLTDCGFADDDQTISLMAYRSKPEIFQIEKIPNWWSWLKIFGGEHLTIKPILPQKKYKQEKKYSKLYYEKKEYLLALKCYYKYILLKIKNI